MVLVAWGCLTMEVAGKVPNSGLPLGYFLLVVVRSHAGGVFSGFLYVLHLVIYYFFQFLGIDITGVLFQFLEEKYFTLA